MLEPNWFCHAANDQVVGTLRRLPDEIPGPGKGVDDSRPPQRDCPAPLDTDGENQSAQKQREKSKLACWLTEDPALVIFLKVSGTADLPFRKSAS
jgi:hypothetical protein